MQFHSILPCVDSDSCPKARSARQAGAIDSCANRRLDLPPQPEETVRRDEDDRQKDQTDQCVVAFGADDIDGEGLDQHDERRRRGTGRSDGAARRSPR